MNFNAIFCCYILYFASFASPTQEAIDCNAGSSNCRKKIGSKVIRTMKKLFSGLTVTADVEIAKSPSEPKEVSSQESISIEIVTTVPKPLVDKFFKQKCDHYHFNDRCRWQQRYLIYDSHYEGNDKMFIRIGTDEDITAWNMQNGRWFEYCKEAKALCIGIECRGYGVSVPHGNLKDENLKYINSEQSLADVAWFIYNFRSLKTGHVLPRKLKWVAYGKSEQGTLAIWLRMKYPHLVHAALSLSAPVLAKADYDDYFKLIEKMLNSEPEFKDEITYAFIDIETYVHRYDTKYLVELFNFCDTNTLEYSIWYRSHNCQYMELNFKHTVAIIMRYSNDDMALIQKQATDIIFNTNGEYKQFDTSIKIFALIIEKMLNKYNKKCLQLNYFHAVNEYRETTGTGYEKLDFLLPKIFGNRASLYQKCTELGRFETLENFFSLQFYAEFCWNVFGNLSKYVILEKGIRRTNVFYGGLNIVVSRVIFVFGSDDPYRNLGIIDRHPPNTLVHILEGARNGNEFDNDNINNPKHDVKNDIYFRLTEWLK